MPQIAFAWSWPWNWVGDTITQTFNAVLNAILVAVFGAILIIVAACSTISSWLLTFAIKYATEMAPYIHSDAVNIGWPIVRNLANMMIVLGFVIIGIAFILRMESYGSKKVLINLIIVALLINFSLLICGIFIDATNILMKYFFTKESANAGLFDKWLPAISDVFGLLSNFKSDNMMQFGAKMLGLIFFYFIAFFVYILYGILILLRVVALWMLIILSPLAFVCYVFPATKRIWDMWWSNFFNWCIIILPAGLFYYIGAKMISVANNTTHSLPDAIGDVPTYLSGTISLAIVPGLFLILGFLISLQMSAMGTGAILNFVSKNKGAIIKGGLSALAKTTGIANKGIESAAGKMASAGGFVGGVGKTAGWLWSKTGAKGAGALSNYRATAAKTRSEFGRLLETAGGVPVGTQAAKDDKNLAAAISALTSALKSGNKKDEQKVFDQIHNGTGRDQVAAIQAAIDTNKLHEAFKDTSGKVDYVAMSAALVAAEKSGAPKNIRKDATDKYYQMAGFSDRNVDAALTTLGHKNAIDAELTTQGITPGTATPAQRMAAAKNVISGPDISRAEEKANYIQLTKNWSNMDLEARANTDLGGLHPDDLKEFALSRNAEDIKAFKLLDAGHDNRTTHKATMLAHINTELATPGISTNRERRLKEVRDELLKL